jgi:hypothetical protein
MQKFFCILFWPWLLYDALHKYNFLTYKAQCFVCVWLSCWNKVKQGEELRNNKTLAPYSKLRNDVMSGGIFEMHVLLCKGCRCYFEHRPSRKRTVCYSLLRIMNKRKISPSFRGKVFISCLGDFHEWHLNASLISCRFTFVPTMSVDIYLFYV